MDLKTDVQAIVDSHSPCLVVAVLLGSARTQTGELETGSVIVQGTLDGCTPDDAVMGLVGLKSAYSHLVQWTADKLGMPDQNLHGRIAEKLNDTPVREEGELHLEVKNSTPDEAAKRLAQDYRAYLNAVESTAAAIGMPVRQFGDLVRKHADQGS